MMEKTEPTTDITAVISHNPALAILDSEKFEAFYEKIKAETETLIPDVSTNKGRDEIRAMAYKVAKTRVAIDKARLTLTEDWRSKTKKANEAGTQIKTRLEALEESVRAPLTAWENAEKLRVEQHDKILKFLSNAALVQFDDNSQIISDRINAILECEINPEIHGVAIDVVKEQKARTLATLNSTLERMKIEEVERAELERLRKEAAEREAVEAARIEAENERNRIEKEKQDAIEAAVAAERERADRIEREAKEEIERRAIEAAKEEAARLAREQDREHRAKIMGAAKSAIMQLGIDDAKARDIVLAIASGSIPAVSIKF